MGALQESGESTPQPYPVPSGFLGLHILKSYFCESCLLIVRFRSPGWKAGGSDQAWKTQQLFTGRLRGTAQGLYSSEVTQHQV